MREPVNERTNDFFLDAQSALNLKIHKIQMALKANIKLMQYTTRQLITINVILKFGDMV